MRKIKYLIGSISIDIGKIMTTVNTVKEIII